METLPYADLIREAANQLFPDAIRKQLPPLYAMETTEDPSVPLKLFTPMSSWTWYIYEGSPVDSDGTMIEPEAPEERQAQAVDFMFFGLVSGEEPELGYVSLQELMSLQKDWRTRIERDVNWKPKTLSAVRESI